MEALVREAMRKASVAWLTVGGRPAYPVWCLWLDDSLYVVSRSGPAASAADQAPPPVDGALEQVAPGLAGAQRAVVTARGDHGGAIVSWPATVTPVRPGTAEWDAAVPALTAKRLNGGSDGWATRAVVSRLTPVG